MEVNNIYYLDYSAGKIAGKTIKSAGYNGVIRYIDAPANWRTKHTNLAEYKDHLANGLEVLLVFEAGTGDADGGYSAGVANAKRAKAGADALGYKGIIFFANDRTTVPNPKTWTDYLDGAASVLGRSRVGAYGFANALNYAKGHASVYWQAGRHSDVVGHAHLWQDNNTQVTVGGITCDRNLILKMIEMEEDDDMALGFDYTNKAIDSRYDSADKQTRPRDMHWFQTKTYDMLVDTNAKVVAANAAITALAKALEGALAGQEMTADDIAAKVEAAVSKALQDNIVHVTVDVNGDEETPAAQ